MTVCLSQLCCFNSVTYCVFNMLGDTQHYLLLHAQVQLLCDPHPIRYAAYWRSKLKENKMATYMTVIRNHTSQSKGMPRIYAAVCAVIL